MFASFEMPASFEWWAVRFEWWAEKAGGAGLPGLRSATRILIRAFAPQVPLGEYFGQFLRCVHQHVRRLLLQCVRGKAVIHTYGPQAGVASGFNVDMRVANDHSFFRSHAVFFEQLACAFGVRLLAGKTVASIDLAEESAQSQRLDDGTGGADRLV